MKLKSLILGSVAAAGLSTAGFAADLGVLTSLDVCDALGLSGLTISSETNCLQISGGVSYEFRYGDYRQGPGTSGGPDIGFVPAIGTESNNIDIIADGGFGDADMDYESKVEAWLKFVGTADSDFGPASATIRLKSVEKTRYTNEGSGTVIDDNGTIDPTDDITAGGISFPDDTNGIIIDEAYVSIGDQTVIMAGKKSSIAEFGDAQPFNFLGTWGYGEVDTGVLFQDDEDEPFTGGQVIQVTSDLGNGVNVSVGLENLQGVSLVDDNGDDDKIEDNGTLIGVVAYAGEGITAHLTGIAIGVLDGEIDDYGVHAGATGTFDLFKVRGAVGYLQYDDGSALNDGLEGSDLHALLSGAATFDLFTVALTGEYTRAEDEGSVDDGFGVGGSVGAAVTDGVSINLGARYFTADFDGNGTTTGDNFDSDILQVAAQVVAELTETIKATGELGVYFTEGFETDDEVYYGSAQLAWAPGGGFTSAVIGEVNSEGGYRATFRAAKTFE